MRSEQEMLDFCIRPMLKRVLEWKIGIQTNFTKSPGKSGKYIKKYLSKNEYQAFLSTYPIPEIDKVWDSAFKMCDLFDQTAKEVSGTLMFTYNKEEAANSRKYLEDIKSLAADATEIY